MLKLIDIKKTYGENENTVHALKGITLEFETKGIVSICGQSGCGKTTLLNIIGGLDRYSSGDIIINGTSTKEFDSGDWDSYRNHNVGFVFQNYYLIPQLTVLENVMIAMNISGVKREEQQRKAIEALNKVGLGNQLKKKPQHLSGGQAQRVAIARAICNNPSIILADEPTGALDSENSVQILELLKELSQESLVIIVTHNNELAQAYSNRIIRMQDGEIISDEVLQEIVSEEKLETEQKPENNKKCGRKKQRTNISVGASFLISLKNLYYKKGRTLITALAGCIGVIAISVILAFNAGFSSYALSFQKSQLSKYPLYVKKSQSSLSDIGDIVAKMDGSNYATLDTSTILEILTDESASRDSYSDEQKVFIQKLITGLVANFDELGKENDTTELKKYIDRHKTELDEICAIKYDYDMVLNVYKRKSGKYVMLSPFSERVIDSLTSQEINLLSKLLFGSTLRDKEKNDIVNALGQVSFWDSLIEDEGILSSQYDLLQGRWPSAEQEQDGVYEIVLVVDKYNQITDAALYALGEIEIMDLVSGILHNSGETIEKMMAKMTNGDFDPDGIAAFFASYKDIKTEYNFSDFIYDDCGKEYYLLADTDYYEKNEEGKFVNISEDNEKVTTVIESQGVSLRISGIVRQKEEVSSGCINGIIGYPQSLSKYIIQKITSSEMVQQQIAAYNDYIALTQTEEYQEYKELSSAISSRSRNIETEPLTMQESMLLAKCSAYGIESVIADQDKLGLVDYEALLSNLGVKQLDVPETIYFYPYSIEASEKIVQFLDKYNQEMEQLYKSGESNKDNSVEYVNELKDIMDSLNGMINTITFILIAVTCLSVVVSAIMVAIIMYISVQDRTKEIGILRSMGARKIDIMNIFNSETVLLGLFSGLIGIFVGYLLTYPLNGLLMKKLFIANLLTPLWWHSLILLAASVVITCISGLVPAIIAAKRDPVKSLRTE